MQLLEEAEFHFFFGEGGVGGVGSGAFCDGTEKPSCIGPAGGAGGLEGGVGAGGGGVGGVGVGRGLSLLVLGIVVISSHDSL